MTAMRPKPPRLARPPGANADHHAANRVPRAVSALASSFAKGHVIAPHFHPRAQLIFGLHGVMTVRAAGSMWTVPASHALWMPAGIEHAIHMDSDVEMRSLYFETRRARGTPKDCQVLYVTPLLRELIVRAMDIAPLYDERGPDGRVMRLIVDEISATRPEPMGLRMPADPRLRKLCDRVLADLSASTPIVDLGRGVGLSERSVIRLFPTETGLSFARWQQQARLLRAFALFDEGLGVTQVALELGYSSGAAFTKMFRRLMGAAPRRALQSFRAESGRA
jgi:AraC-like DNA-binding protein/quercetin dioxygenase-like cupin family protein